MNPVAFVEYERPKRGVRLPVTDPTERRIMETLRYQTLTRVPGHHGWSVGDGAEIFSARMVSPMMNRPNLICPLGYKDGRTHEIGISCLGFLRVCEDMGWEPTEVEKHILARHEDLCPGTLGWMGDSRYRN